MTMNLPLSTNAVALPFGPSGGFSLNNTFGAILLGTYFALILYGGTIYQTLWYYNTYPDDILWLKALVLSVVSLDTIHTALCTQACYYLLVTGYSDSSVLEHLPMSVSVIPILTASTFYASRRQPAELMPDVKGAIIGASQVFFVRRAYVFGCRYRGWAILVAMLLLCEFALSLATTIDSLETTPTVGLLPPHPWIVVAAAGSAVAADGILTTIMTLYLRRSRTGMERTDSLMNVLILYSITTGFLTSAWMLVVFVFAITRPHDVTYVALSIVVTKLYTNTLLIALNTRRSLRAAATDPFGVAVVFGSSGSGGLQERRSRQGIDLHDGDTVALELSEMRIRNDGTKA